MTAAKRGTSRCYGVRKGAWSEEEDVLLRECIDKYGEGKWHQVPLKSGLNRCRKSCRLRWLNYLKPNIKRGEFNVDEADLIIRLHKLLGNRWSLIAGRLPGRTANHVKNYWNTHLRKKTMLPLQVMNPHPATITHAAAVECHQSKVIRPRPRTFSKTLVQCMRSEQQQQTSGRQHFITTDGNHVNMPMTAVGKDGHEGTIPLASASTEDDALEQIQWWKSLLDDQLSDQEVAALASGSCAMEVEVEQGYEIAPARDDSDDVGANKIFADAYGERPAMTGLSELSFDIELWDFLSDEWQATSSLLRVL